MPHEDELSDLELAILCVVERSALRLEKEDIAKELGVTPRWDSFVRDAILALERRGLLNEEWNAGKRWVPTADGKIRVAAVRPTRPRASRSYMVELRSAKNQC